MIVIAVVVIVVMAGHTGKIRKIIGMSRATDSANIAAWGSGQGA
jgi:hypothetical protein